MSRWRLSDWDLGLLVALAVMAAWEGIAVNNWPATRGCGGDFPQYYVAGTIVRRGEAARLYDQPYFCHFQESDARRSAPFDLPADPGIAHGAADAAFLPGGPDRVVGDPSRMFLATGVIFYRTSPLPRPWRIKCWWPWLPCAVVDRRGHRPIVADVPAAGGGLWIVRTVLLVIAPTAAPTGRPEISPPRTPPRSRHRQRSRRDPAAAVGGRVGGHGRRRIAWARARLHLIVRPAMSSMTSTSET